jgi:hypothetical protein
MGMGMGMGMGILELKRETSMNQLRKLYPTSGLVHFTLS